MLVSALSAVRVTSNYDHIYYSRGKLNFTYGPIYMELVTTCFTSATDCKKIVNLYRSRKIMSIPDDVVKYFYLPKQ